MNGYADCPECGEEMSVEYVNNGVGMVWHGVHCGWGQTGWSDEDIRAMSKYEGKVRS